MRVLTLAPLLAGLAVAGALAACAGTGSSESDYAARTEKLAADCEARGGILVFTGGQSGRPEVDNVCKITGGASRLPHRN